MIEAPRPPAQANEPNARETLLASEIRDLRDELRGIRADLHQLNQTLAKTDSLAGRPTRPSLIPSVLSDVSDRYDRAGARWRAYRSRFRHEWSPGGLRWDMLAVAVILVLAGVLRYYHLDTIPLGVQGDEAAAGLEAHRIMETGWIGVFSPASAGNPTAFYYLTVIPIWLFGDSIHSIRLLSATLDMLTVLGLYVLLRRNFGWGTAVLGSSFLAVSSWHIHFSRISFMNILWPLTVMIGAIALGEAYRSGSKIWWAISGAGFALGIYAYNGHFLFLGILALAMAWIFFGWTALVAGGLFLFAYREPGWPALVPVAAGLCLLALNRNVRSSERVLSALSFGAGFGVAIWPMAQFILAHEDEYFGRGRRVSIFRTEDWTGMVEWTDKIRFLAERYIEFWRQLTLDPALDAVAGNGSAGVVPLTAVILGAVGIGLALARRKGPLVSLGALAVVLMPFAPIASNDFALRRAMIMAPFLAMFCGIAIVEVIRSTWSQRRTVQIMAIVIVAAVTANVGYRNINDFFTNTATSSEMRWVLGPELVEAAAYVDELPDGAYVYFFSARWPFDHETIRYLAPDTRGETRGEPYGPDSIEIDPADGRAVFVLMGEYQLRLPEIQARYPGGTVSEGPRLSDPDTGPTYVAYVLPVQ